MEARERVDGTDDPQELQRLLTSTQAQQRRVEGQLSAAFGAGRLERAASLVTELTYFVRLEEAIVEKM